MLELNNVCMQPDLGISLKNELSANELIDIKCIRLVEIFKSIQSKK